MFTKLPLMLARSIQDDNHWGNQMPSYSAAMTNALVRYAVFLLLAASLSAAQGQNASSLKTEYLDDFAESCKHLDQLSQAIPANKYAWRPGAGVRSVKRSLRPYRQWQLPAPLLDRSEAPS